MMMDNPLEDLIPPKYVSNTVNLDLAQKEYDNQMLDVIVATWNAEEAHVRGPGGGCYGALMMNTRPPTRVSEDGPSTEEGCTVDFFMPTYMPGGIYSLSVIRNIDAAGNDKQLIFRSDYPDELPWDAQDAGEPAAIIEFVSDNPDLLPPEIDLNESLCQCSTNQSASAQWRDGC